MKRRDVLLVAVAALALAPTARACLWDRDTLGYEAGRFPGSVAVITGRFERNPPLYFELRLKRISDELKQHPERLALYDDVGVACDRLKRGDEAVAWMEAKAAAMKRFPSAAPDDDRYRYLANLGTFRAHRWLRGGARREELAELRQARDEIAGAIALNPNAHFGREKYQLAALEWLITSDKRPFRDALSREKPDEAIKGLSGLIVLGDAWQSPDIFDALRYCLGRSSAGPLAYLAALRVDELLRSGRHSAAPELELDLSARLRPDSNMVLALNAANIEKNFKPLRDEAESWHGQRTAYMEARLKQGRHPDTDETFWKEWHEPPAPPIQVPLSVRLSATLGPMAPAVLLLLTVLVVLGAIVVVLARARRART
jgi:hypothetical protein